MFERRRKKTTIFHYFGHLWLILLWQCEQQMSNKIWSFLIRFKSPFRCGSNQVQVRSYAMRSKSKQVGKATTLTLKRSERDVTALYWHDDREQELIAVFLNNLKPVEKYQTTMPVMSKLPNHTPPWICCHVHFFFTDLFDLNSQVSFVTMLMFLYNLFSFPCKCSQALCQTIQKETCCQNCSFLFSPVCVCLEQVFLHRIWFTCKRKKGEIIHPGIKDVQVKRDKKLK